MVDDVLSSLQLRTPLTILHSFLPKIHTLLVVRLEILSPIITVTEQTSAVVNNYTIAALSQIDVARIVKLGAAG